MAVDAVPAAIRYADDDVDQLLGQRVEHPRRHDRFDPVPGTLQKLRVDRQRLPEVVDPVGLPRRHDIVVYLTHRRDCRVVLNQGHGCHRPPPSDLVSCTSVLDWGRLADLRAQTRHRRELAQRPLGWESEVDLSWVLPYSGYVGSRAGRAQTKPITIDFHVTSECSQECPYCWGPQQIPALKTRTARRIIDRVKHFGVQRIVFTGVD